MLRAGCSRRVWRLSFLSTTDTARAFELAHELEQLNSERAELQNQIWDEVRDRVEKGIAAGKYKHGIAVADPGWHEGVVGIVASRVTETFRRPAAVISVREDFAKGSVRSYGGKDVLAALRESAGHLLGFGGHKHAAGLSLKPENLDAFADAFDDALSKIEVDAKGTPLLIEGSCNDRRPGSEDFAGTGAPRPLRPGKSRARFLLQGGSQGSPCSQRASFEAQSRFLPTPSRTRQIEAIWFHGAEQNRTDSPEFAD